MILQLTPNTHPILHERVKPCSNDLDRREISRILRENMFHYEGIGLSANQIGISERVFIMMLNMETEETITCFNPRIIKRYEDDVWYEEGCLSIPETFIEIERPKTCIVEYVDISGNKKNMECDGLLSTCVQHEINHLDGKLIIDFLSKLKKDILIKKLSKNKNTSSRVIV